MTNQREIRYAQAQNEAIRLSMRRDPNVIVMGEDIAGGAGRAHLGIIDAWGGPFRSTKGLIQEFGPERVRDTPLSEGAFIGTAIGAATVGLRPIVELMFIDFLGVCLDQILNNGAKLRYMLGGQVSVPVTILTRIGAGTGSAAQHSESFYSVIAHMPGLKCVAPSDAYTAKGLLAAAILDDDPVIVCDHKRLLNNTGPVPEEEYTLPLGKARILRHGRDVTLVGISLMTSVCMEAAEVLAKQGVDAEVVDLLSLSPAGRGDGAGFGGKDGPHRHRGRGHAALQRCHGHRRPGGGPGLRPPGRPAQDRDRPPHSRALQPAAGGAVRSQRGPGGGHGLVALVRCVGNIRTAQCRPG